MGELSTYSGLIHLLPSLALDFYSIKENIANSIDLAFIILADGILFFFKKSLKPSISVLKPLFYSIK